MKRSGYPDYIIIFTIAFLVIFGLAMLASASSYLGQSRFDDSYYYLKHQLLYGLGIGVVGFLASWKLSYRWYQKLSPILLLITVALLFLVFTPLGLKAANAERWVQLGPVTFQPAELLKLTFVLYLAAWLGSDQSRNRSFTKGFLPLLLVIALIMGLLLKQPTTSMVVILLAAALMMYFTSGARLAYISGFIFLGAAALALVIAITPYRLDRITNFIRPADLESGGYHLNQARIAIGSGGLFGVGYGQSTTKIHYLPEPAGDSIFAVIGEELGFAGSLFLIALFALLTIRIFRLAHRVSDRFARLTLVGFGAVIAVQGFMNMAAISGLIPLTGVPLPFISYGGTALAMFMTMSGIIVNISKYS